MFFLTFSSVWSFSYFFYLSYLTFVLSTIFYIVPVLGTNQSYSFANNNFISDIITGFDFVWIVTIPYMTLFMLNWLWVSPAFSVWFGHVVYNSFQSNMVCIIIINFLIILFSLLNTSYFSSSEIYDYFITTFSFLYWIIILFCSNSIFTAIFLVEVISTLIFLFLITSVFSTSFFYSNLDFSFGSFFQMSNPHTYIQSIIFFFWMSLIASLSLFIFIIFLYINITTLDYYLIEYIFGFCLYNINSQNLLGLCITWFIFIFSVFLNCGMAPIFFWNPTFFNGIPLYSIMFYITFFYFFIFLFFIVLFSSYLGEIFYTFIVVNLLFILSGVVILLFILCESFYINSFMAMSSILNSILILLVLSTIHINSLYIWL